MICCTVKFHIKIFQNSCIPGESCFKFQMKCLNCRNFKAAHSFLTDWHHFTFLTVAPFLCAPSAKLDFCFILVASNTVILARLFVAHRFKLKVEDSIFHVVVFSIETFQILAWKFLLFVSQKVFRVYIFLILFSRSTQLFKNQLKHTQDAYILFLFSGGM